MTCESTNVVRVDPAASAAYLAQMQALIDQYGTGRAIEFAIQAPSTLLWRYVGDTQWQTGTELPGGEGGAFSGVFGDRYPDTGLNALRPPLASSAERLANAPAYLGEILTDSTTGESYQGVQGDGALVWSKVGLPTGLDLGALLLASEDGTLEAASVYPVLLNQLTLSFRSAAATILALHRARSK